MRSGCLLPASDLAWAALCAESTSLQLCVRVLLSQTEGVCGVGLVPASPHSSVDLGRHRRALHQWVGWSRTEFAPVPSGPQGSNECPQGQAGESSGVPVAGGRGTVWGTLISPQRHLGRGLL